MFATLVAALAVAGPTCPLDRPVPPSPPIAAAIEALVETHDLPGATVIVCRGGETLVHARAGGFQADHALPVASASKWMASALVMTFVDEGLLDLDAPVETVLPELSGEAGRLTLRQLLSFTAGQGGLRGLADVRQSPDLTLAESAAEIARRPPQDPPGRVFRYGGPSLQIAGAMVERVAGRPWAEVFDERLAAPLHLEHTWWSSAPLPGRDQRPGVSNPNLQSGVITTAEDYMRFLAMIAGGGEADGRRYLSSQALDEMESAQTLDVAMQETRGGMAADGRPVQYALGNWCEAHDDRGDCTVVSSPGAFGAYPWVDRDTGTYGMVFLKDRLPNVVTDIQRLRTLIMQDEAQSPGSSARQDVSRP